MSAQLELNRILSDWDTTLRAYATAGEEAANAEADHKRLRGKAIVTERHRDPKAAMTLCEAIADADDEVASALNRRLIADATLDAIRGKLKWFQAAADGKRSEISSERANAALYATSGPGL
jgi:hypothetical protein